NQDHSAITCGMMHIRTCRASETRRLLIDSRNDISAAARIVQSAGISVLSSTSSASSRAKCREASSSMSEYVKKAHSCDADLLSAGARRPVRTLNAASRLPQFRFASLIAYVVLRMARLGRRASAPSAMSSKVRLSALVNSASNHSCSLGERFGIAPYRRSICVALHVNLDKTPSLRWETLAA